MSEDERLRGSDKTVLRIRFGHFNSFQICKLFKKGLLSRVVPVIFTET